MRKRKKRGFKMSKNTICMPTHLPVFLAQHVAGKAYEREWSNSQYLRWLVMQDKKRCEDDSQLMSEVTGIPREQFDLIERNERNKKA